MGRFVSVDSIVPDPNMPQAFNRYSYVNNNPLRYTDLTGHCGGDKNDPNNPDYDCWKKLREIEAAFANVSVNPDWWTYDELALLMETLQAIYDVFGNQDTFTLAFGNLRFNRGYYLFLSPNATGQYWRFSGDITLFDRAFTSDEEARFTIIHEMGHAFDMAELDKNGLESWFTPPKNVVFMKEGIWSSGCIMLFAACQDGVSDMGVTRSYATTDSLEDFADTFAVYVYNQLGWNPPVSQPSQKRLEVIKNFVALTIFRATDSSNTP